jgi:unsaturated chondroitin disaccharide hydrolase
MNIKFVLTLLLATIWLPPGQERAFVGENYSFAAHQLQNLLNEADKNPDHFPRTIDRTGKMTGTSMYDWTPGFFPGNLWYVYEYTKDTAFRNAAVRWTEKLAPLQHFTGHHDLGFMVYCSYGNAYRLTGNETYKQILVTAARSLSTRFNSRTGTIKSWEHLDSWHGNKRYTYPVIIDNMMNLELLFFASKASGDTIFRHIAVSHAEKTMEYQVRKDFSCYHVVCYDSLTGKVLGRETAQGYADNSAWSRGQAWGIYGFTMVYRETKDPRFLRTAIGMADRYLDDKRLPADKVPFWDFNANEKGYTPGIKSNAVNIKTLPRDASAAAITASALLELATYCIPEKAARYNALAKQMLHSLASPAYRAKPGSNGNFILTHSVGSIPHNNEIDVPLVYADYYFLEAMYRYNQFIDGERIVAERY